jgi:hypothetical protein
MQAGSGQAGSVQAGSVQAGSQFEPTGPFKSSIPSVPYMPFTAKSWEPAVLYREGELLDYRARWTELQMGFVDQPRRAVERAEALVETLMALRGLSWRTLHGLLGESPHEHQGESQIEDQTESAAELRNSRPRQPAALRDLRHDSFPRESTTEDLRRAMVSFHSLFEELLAIAG